MNIREVIDRLHEVAQQLPNGLDSDVKVSICNQDEPGLTTSFIEVDTLWRYNRDNNVMTGSFAVVIGHPHHEKDGGKTTPLTAEIDNIAQQWAVDQAEGKSGAPDPITVKTDNEEYALLPLSEGVFVKLPFIEGRPLLPGHPDAVEAGCTCNPERNNYGFGHPYDDGVEMVVKDDCPIHPHVAGPTDPANE